MNHTPVFRAHLAVTPTAPILVIDDNACIRNVVSDILSMEGYRVQLATDGAEALDFIERTVPALAVHDMLMPVLDGWGFARGLKERQVRLPILVITAGATTGNWADEIGAGGWIPKPFDLDDLLDMVKHLLTCEWPNGHGARGAGSASP